LPLPCKTSRYGTAGIQLTENVEQDLISVWLDKPLHSANISSYCWTWFCYLPKNHNSQFHYCLFTLMFFVWTGTACFSFRLLNTVAHVRSVLVAATFLMTVCHSIAIC